MTNRSFFIIDFDSTFVRVEALDELSRIVLADRSDRDNVVSQIESITKLGMDGKITFTESLERRLTLFSPRLSDIEKLIELLEANITQSVQRNRDWFIRQADSIYIISGGFKEYIVPIVSDFGIEQSHVLANEFVYDSNGSIIGFDTRNYLSQHLGKVKQLEALHLDGKIVVIGDGYTDYQIREYGKADRFYAFVENVQRESVASKADRLLASFDDLISS